VSPTQAWSGPGLADGEDVSVRIFKPGDAGAAWSEPDAEIVLFHSLESLGDNAGGAECAHAGVDIGDRPAEHGVGRDGRLVDDADAQCRAVCIEGTGVGIFREEGQSERLDIEVTGPGQIGRGHECDEIASSEHLGIRFLPAVDGAG
jgi:hypothetical protein